MGDNPTLSDARRRWENARLHVPAALRRLAGREQEIATVVFSRREASANEVVDALSDSLSNSAVRSMLNRLVSKQVIGRKWQNGLYVYFRADNDPEFHETLLKGVAKDYFDSSLSRFATALLALIRREQPELITELATYLEPAPDLRDQPNSGETSSKQSMGCE
jgi:predicted transcriptional regulator